MLETTIIKMNDMTFFLGHLLECCVSSLVCPHIILLHALSPLPEGYPSVLLLLSEGNLG
jgi:hypothetical protein